MTKQEFEQEIWKALKTLVTLEIVTVVGTYDTVTNKPGDGSKMMRTRLDLLQGDKVTEIDDAFVTGTLVSLREYHANAEASGHQIIKSNLEILERLLGLVGRLGSTN